MQIVSAVLCYCACTELLNDLNEIGPIFTLWSNSEDKLRQPLAVFAKSVEKSFVELQTLVRAAVVQLDVMDIKCYISWSLAVYFPCIVTVVLKPALVSCVINTWVCVIVVCRCLQWRPTSPISCGSTSCTQKL